MRSRFARGLAALATGTAALAAVLASGPAQAATPLKVHYNWTTGFVANMPVASRPPAGAITTDAAGHLARCSSPGKLPVVLVHGTWENQKTNWSAAAPLLKNAGFCVYTLTYGGNPNDVMAGWKSVAASSVELGVFIDKVRAATGSKQVDVVGHSQGGMMPRYYLKFGTGWTGGAFGKGQPKIRKLIGMAPSNHGTTLSGITQLGRALGIDPLKIPLQPAAIDQQIKSPFNAKLDSCPNGPAADVCAGDTVQYTVIATKMDEVVTPWEHSFLTANPAAPKATVKNILVQSGCKVDRSEHLALAYDSYAYGFVLKALGVDPSTVPGAKPACKVVLPLVGA